MTFDRLHASLLIYRKISTVDTVGKLLIILNILFWKNGQINEVKPHLKMLFKSSVPTPKKMRHISVASHLKNQSLSGV
jgi:hypothetical protein